MRNLTSKPCLAALAGALVLCMIAATSASAAPLTGAIFTTNVNGTRVNQNLFTAFCDVYLDGGPGPFAPAGAAGLPDGDYFFQVTDPSGKKLLSTDPVKNRQFAVAGGVITGLSGAGNHGTGDDVDNAAKTIQLCPYLETPNPGGVYKVWVTRTSDLVGNPDAVDPPSGRGLFHGFVPAASKVDNYKVAGLKTLPCLTVLKFDDADGDGKLDGSEPLIVWPIEVVDPNGAQIGAVYTPNFPHCMYPNLIAGTYRVTEGTKDGCTVTATFVDGKALSPADSDILVKILSADRSVLFGNHCSTH